MQFSNVVIKIRVRAQRSFSWTHTNCQLVWGVTFDPNTLEHSLCLVEQFLWTPTNRIRLSSRISGPGPSTEDHPHSLKLPPPSFFPVTLRATHVPSRGEFLGWLSAQFLHIYMCSIHHKCSCFIFWLRLVSSCVSDLQVSAFPLFSWCYCRRNLKKQRHCPKTHTCLQNPWHTFTHSDLQHSGLTLTPPLCQGLIFMGAVLYLFRCHSFLNTCFQFHTVLGLENSCLQMDPNSIYVNCC